MRKIKAADARAGPHGAAFGQFDAGVLFGVEQLPERPLLGVVGAGRIAGGGADAAVLFADQILGGQLLQLAEAPFLARALVQVLGKGLRQAIRQSLGHNRVVIVVIALKLLAERLDAESRRHGKSADVIPKRASSLSLRRGGTGFLAFSLSLGRGLGSGGSGLSDCRSYLRAL